MNITAYDSVLRDEAVYLTRFFFNKETPSIVSDRYIAAHKLVFEKLNSYESIQPKITSMIIKRADIEAIELAWRISDANNILSKKIYILFYILESRSEFFPHFLNKNTSSIFSIFKLGFSITQTVYRFFKGKILLRRYELV